MKKLLRNNRGSGYIDVVIMILCSMLVLVLALNTFTFLAQKQSLDYYAREMLTIAVVNGTTANSDIVERQIKLTGETGLNPDIDYSESEASYDGKVQYGDIITVKLTYSTTFKGFGIFDIPISLTVQKSGISQKHWK